MITNRAENNHGNLAERGLRFLRDVHIGLGAIALVGVVVALVAWFSFNNLPFLIGGGVVALIGLIIFGYGTRALPK